MCTDTSVLGRAFYPMGFVDGWSPMDQRGWPAPFDADIEARQELGYQLADGIALLSRVDWQSTTTSSWPSRSSPSSSSRASSGPRDDFKLQSFGPIVLDLMRDAAELAESTEYGHVA